MLLCLIVNNTKKKTHSSLEAPRTHHLFLYSSKMELSSLQLKACQIKAASLTFNIPLKLPETAEEPEPVKRPMINWAKLKEDSARMEKEKWEGRRLMMITAQIHPYTFQCPISMLTNNFKKAYLKHNVNMWFRAVRGEEKLLL